MRRCFSLALAIVSATGLAAGAEKLTDQQRIELIRGLTAEYATVKAQLPRSKKDLPFQSTGEYDKEVWADAWREFGPAARVGDLVQVSKIDIQDKKIVLEINGGFNSGKPKWWQRIEVGMGGSGRTTPIGQPATNAPSGTSIALLFPGRVPPLKPEHVKQMLAPVLDFEKRSAAETFMESLPPEFQEAVKEKRAVEGMNRDQVIFAMGRPVRKVRETKDGMELEDWIYGTPPGRIVFVTFNGDKVIKVKEDYAGLGMAAPPLQSPR